MKHFARWLLAPIALATVPAAAQPPAYGPRLEGFDYPHMVQIYALESQGQQLEMAYMDVIPTGSANGQVALLLHGKNFCAATWSDTIGWLAQRGYRVIAPDQIGFCKSSKPAAYQFSFDQLAANTHALLDHLQIAETIVIGHSMGGMLASRYALSYPNDVRQLVLVNPIGLEDWRAKGVPYASVDATYAGQLATDAGSIRAYQEKFYYAGDWKPEYDRWVDMQAGLFAGEGKQANAWVQALTSDMVFTQPVVQDFPQIEVPTLLMIGQQDRTAPGANRASPELAARLGDYPALGRAAADAIPDAVLVEFDDLGHSPQVEAPDRFHRALGEHLLPN